VIEQVGAAEGGKRSVVGFKEVFVEGIDIAAQGEGFADAWVAGEQEDAAPAFDVVEPCQALFEGFGIEGLAGLDIFIEREALQSEPGE